MELEMDAKYFRDLAKEDYKKYSNKGALTTLVYQAILGAGSAATIGVGALVLPGVMGYGYSYYTKEVKNDSEQLSNLFKGFDKFLNTFLLGLLLEIYVALWTLLLIVPGIIKSLAYSMAYFIMVDNPEMSSNDAITESKEMMNGYKWRLFCLLFSYIGWHLLAILTLGILEFWITPKIKMAEYEFYLEIKKNPRQETVTE